MLQFFGLLNRYWAVGWLVVTSLVGLFSILSSSREQRARRARAAEFIAKFRTFASDLHRDNSFESGVYEWLIKRSGPMQNEMGTLGEMAYYRPPLASYMIPRYEVLVNTIPEMARRTAHPHLVATCDESLMRYMGFLEDIGAEVHRRLVNPFLWFRQGVRVEIAFPFALLKWFGLLSVRAAVQIMESGVLKFVSGLVALIGLLASIIQITTGWAPFVEWLRGHLP